MNYGTIAEAFYRMSQSIKELQLLVSRTMSEFDFKRATAIFNHEIDVLDNRVTILEAAEVSGLSTVQVSGLTSGTDTDLHWHSSDRQRSNHTGTQLASTISDFASAVQSVMPSGVGSGIDGTLTAGRVPIASAAKTVIDSPISVGSEVIPGCTTIRIIDTTPGNYASLHAGNPAAPTEISYEIQNGDTALSIAQHLMEALEAAAQGWRTPYDNIEIYTDYDVLYNGDSFRLYSTSGYVFAPFADGAESIETTSAIIGFAGGVQLTQDAQSSQYWSSSNFSFNGATATMYGANTIYDASQAIKLLEYLPANEILNILGSNIQFSDGYIRSQFLNTTRLTTLRLDTNGLLVRGRTTAGLSSINQILEPANITDWLNNKISQLDVTAPASGCSASGLHGGIHDGMGLMVSLRNVGSEGFHLNNSTTPYNGFDLPYPSVCIEPGQSILLCKGNSNNERWFPIGHIPFNGYAEIYVTNPATFTVPSGSAYTVATAVFDTNGLSHFLTPDVANNNITVPKTGIYRVSADFCTYSNANNITLTTAIFVNGVETHCHIKRKFANATDVSSGHTAGLIRIAEGETVDVRCFHDYGSPVDLTVVYGNLAVQYYAHSD